MYCDQMGASSPTGQCLAGYYCEYGVDRNDPTGGNRTLVGGACVAAGQSDTPSLKKTTHFISYCQNVEDKNINYLITQIYSLGFCIKKNSSTF